MCVDASAVTVRADWRSQSVSQSVGSAPAATHDRVDFSCSEATHVSTPAVAP